MGKVVEESVAILHMISGGVCHHINIELEC
jgi:hypothetical protein